MAYLNIRDAELSGSLQSAFHRVKDIAPARAEPARFAPLEWLVVALAERDSLSSLRQPGRIGSALARLFGSGQRRLANPQLEALRRLAVHAWHYGHAVAPSELAAFRGAGFSAGQAELLLDNILSRRAAKRARRHA